LPLINVEQTYGLIGVIPSMKIFRVLFVFFGVMILILPRVEASEEVMVSIKPIHSLVAGVMWGVAEPGLIVEGAGSPHGYSLKPSQARDIENARAIFWIGHELETFLEKPIEALANDATVVELSHASDLHRISDAESDGHGHGTTHMHFWLDPQNAKVLVTEIKKALQKMDPAHAPEFEANAKALQGRLDGLNTEILEMLKPVKEKPFAVFHDAYRYFENRFGLNSVGAVTLSPEIIPGAKRISEIRDKIKSGRVVCVFTEPQFKTRLVRVVTEGTDTRSGVLDPLGAIIDPGPDLYFTLMRNMASSMHSCLSGKS
jgi:zinc transport system substrate-binding protein